MAFFLPFWALPRLSRRGLALSGDVPSVLRRPSALLNVLLQKEPKR